MVENIDNQRQTEISREEKETIASIRNELAQHKDNIEKSIQFFGENIKNKCPKYISSKKFEETVWKINLWNPSVITLLKWVEDKRLPDVAFNAGSLKSIFWKALSDEEAIQAANKGETASDIYLRIIPNDARNIDVINNNISSIMSHIFKLIDEWKDPFKEDIFLPSDILFSDENIINSLKFKDDKRFLRLDALPKHIQTDLLRWIWIKYWDILNRDINKILIENPGTSPASLFYNDEIFQLCVEYYNVFQLNKWRSPLDWKSLSDKDNQDIQRFFNAKLFSRGFNVNDVDEKTLEELEENERRIREENEKLLEEYKRKSRELNAWLQLDFPIEDIETKTKVVENIDMQNASWVDIAKNAWLWKELMEQYNNVENQEEWQYDEHVFSITWSKFIESHNELKSYITEDVISKLYDQNDNIIKNLNDWARDWLKKIFQDHPDEIQKIYNQLLNFPDEINNTKKELAENAESKRNIYDENRINYAVGAVIDDVRDAFSTVSNNENIDDINWNFNWFKLNEELPVEKVWNDIIIRGSFDGSEVKVRYDLETWKLFMNSFLHKLSVDKFNIWDNSLIDLQIGQIKPFNRVLNEYNTSLKSSSYDNSNNEVDKVLDSQMDLIGNAIKENSQNQAYKNSAITNFMRTFNIVSDSWRFNSFDFNNWSNLFDVIQILDNSDSSNLEYFNNVFMPTVMEYSWLKYWEKNIIQDKKNKKSETIFEYNGDNDNKKYLKDKIKNFNSEQFSWIANFNSNHQLWFADLIKLKITSWSKPTWKLDIKKMDDFIKDIEGENEPLPNNVI